MNSLPPNSRFSTADIAIGVVVFVMVAVAIYAGVWQYILHETEACRARCLEQGKLLGEYRPPSVNGRGGSGTQAQCICGLPAAG